MTLLAVAGLGASSSIVHATVTQPNGLVVPIVNNDEDDYAITLPPTGRQVTLPRFFTARGEAIDYSVDARTTPTVFPGARAGPVRPPLATQARTARAAPKRAASPRTIKATS